MGRIRTLGVVIGGAALVVSGLAGCTAHPTAATSGADARGSTGSGFDRTMTDAEASASDAFAARMDATYASGAPESSLNGELQHGDSGDPMSTSTGPAPGRIAVTLACTGGESVVMRLRFAHEAAQRYRVRCGTPRHFTVVTTAPGWLGFGVSADSADHPDIYYYAGFDSAPTTV